MCNFNCVFIYFVMVLKIMIVKLKWKNFTELYSFKFNYTIESVNTFFSSICDVVGEYWKGL